jgi:hypothetical protein
MRFVTEARAQLDAAAEVFERLGAQPWADRAAGELRATQRSRTGAKHGSVTLTAQEQEIAARRRITEAEAVVGPAANRRPRGAEAAVPGVPDGDEPALPRLHMASQR